MPDADAILARGIAEPIGAAPLRDIVGREDRVLILVDDSTRATPVANVLRHVVGELEVAGVPAGRIALLTAQGTHRRMTDAELLRKLGSFHVPLVVHQHDWRDEAALHDFGRTSDGTRVTANRLLADVDCVADNPMRRRIEEAAELLGIRYIVNCVSDGAGHLAGCFAGYVVAAHRAGCRLSRDINEVMLPARADVVLVDSHPADRDVWQSAKAVYSGAMAVRDGGTLMVVAPNPEGVAENHPIMLEVGYHPFPELARMVRTRTVEDIVGISVLADLAQVRDRVHCTLVSPGVPCDQAERIGFRHASSAQDALGRALEDRAPEASVAVLRRGGQVLPRVVGERHGAMHDA